MSAHTFHEIFLHFNWHVKHDHPTLKDDVEALARRLLREKVEWIRGAQFIEIGGTDTHVHLAVQIEPQVAASELVQELKGSSAFEVNKQLNRKVLEWQRGYGVVSFGRKNLPWVVEYIRNQRERHARGSIFEKLEICSVEESPAEAGE